MAYSLYQFTKYTTQRDIFLKQAMIESERTEFSQRIAYLERVKNAVESELNALKDKKTLSDDEQQKIIAYNSDLKDLNIQINKAKAIFDAPKEREKNSNSLTNPASFLLSFTLPLIATGIIFYSGLIFLAINIRRLRRQYRLQRKFPNKVGLYSLAKSLLEHLKYQATITSSQDASLDLWKLATKFARSKQLETRPISMPGLTADFNTFLNNASDVFGGKSVICLDELDKIIDPDQLEELLKGVKGILGQSRSHFLLTVSEDALARFSTRRRSERDVLESSFDEIIHLNRVNFGISKHID